MLRFKVGELAIFAVTRSAPGVKYVGTLVRVVQIGPWRAGDLHEGTFFLMDSDYVAQADDGVLGEVADYQLRKIDPPAEPASLTRQAEDEVAA